MSGQKRYHTRQRTKELAAIKKKSTDDIKKLERTCHEDSYFVYSRNCDDQKWHPSGTWRSFRYACWAYHTGNTPSCGGDPNASFIRIDRRMRGDSDVQVQVVFNRDLIQIYAAEYGVVDEPAFEPRPHDPNQGPQTFSMNITIPNKKRRHWRDLNPRSLA